MHASVRRNYGELLFLPVDKAHLPQAVDLVSCVANTLTSLVFRIGQDRFESQNFGAGLCQSISDT